MSKAFRQLQVPKKYHRTPFAEVKSQCAAFPALMFVFHEIRSLQTIKSLMLHFFVNMVFLVNQAWATPVR